MYPYTPKITPRDYQAQAVDALYSYFSKNSGNPIVIMPTGTGKSIVIGDFMRGALHRYPETRLMCLMHVKELIGQNSEKLSLLWPGAPAGIYSAGLKQKDNFAPIIFGGVRSVANNVASFGHRDLLLIDECHLLSPKQTTTYRYVIDELLKINPHMKVIGFTATDFRLGQGRLTNSIEDKEGNPLPRLFTDVAIDMSTVEWWNWFIAHGYLVPPIPMRTSVMLDASNVGMSNGDYALGQLQAAVDTPELNEAVCAQMCSMAHDRKKWLAFCAGVEHAEHIAEVLNKMGIRTCAIHSKMSDERRDELVAAYKAGEYRCATNNNVLTTGFDDPEIDYIAMLRHTMSPGLWVQMIGRGTRPSPGKSNCLVGDFVRNTQRLGPINDPVIPSPKGKSSGDIPVKLCDMCGAYNHISARVCVGCGEPFSIENKLHVLPSSEELLASDLPVLQKFNVRRVFYAEHFSKKDGRQSIRVQYLCSNSKVYSEWINFQSDIPFLKHKSHKWWNQRTAFAIPETNDVALNWLHSYPITVPSTIEVWTNRKYPEIMRYEFT